MSTRTEYQDKYENDVIDTAIRFNGQTKEFERKFEQMDTTQYESELTDIETCYKCLETSDVYRCECCNKMFCPDHSAKVTQFGCTQRNACIDCQENSKYEP